MNIEQAKKLSLPDLMTKLGHEPMRTKKGGYELWYRSPFREETDESFHTSFINGKWIWKDFGDIGGTVIDFVMRHEGYTSVRDALGYLQHHFSTPSSRKPSLPKPAPAPDLFSFHQQPHREAVENYLESELEFLSAIPIKNPVIMSYLNGERRIPANIAKRYLQEVRYKHTASGKEYFGFGMQNQAGGWEVRPASSKYKFKAPLIARDISVIPGTSAERTTAHIFEGMTDFLSYLVLTGAEQLPDDAIIMHSLSSYNRAAAHIRAQNYEHLRTYLDNDKAGQQGTERFKADFGAKVLPQGERFANSKDVNDELRARMASRGNNRG
ncbi:toprim domain-containing protein [Spirosoma aerophilum]